MRKKEVEKIAELCEVLDLEPEEVGYLFACRIISQRLKWIWITLCGMGVLGVISLVHFW